MCDLCWQLFKITNQLHVVRTGQDVGGYGSHGHLHAIDGGQRTIRGTTGNKSQVTLQYSSSATKDLPTGSTAV